MHKQSSVIHKPNPWRITNLNVFIQNKINAAECKTNFVLTTIFCQMQKLTFAQNAMQNNKRSVILFGDWDLFSCSIIGGGWDKKCASTN